MGGSVNCAMQIVTGNADSDRHNHITRTNERTTAVEVSVLFTIVVYAL